MFARGRNAGCIPRYHWGLSAGSLRDVLLRGASVHLGNWVLHHFNRPGARVGASTHSALAACFRSLPPYRSIGQPSKPEA
jgi:hypothetical protein